MSELEKALRHYEKMHAIYMDTPVFGHNGPLARLNLDNAREHYLSEYEKIFPGRLIMGSSSAHI